MVKPLVYIVLYCAGLLVVLPRADAVHRIVVERYRYIQMQHLYRVATLAVVTIRTYCLQGIREEPFICHQIVSVVHVRMILRDQRVAGVFLYPPYVHRIRIAVITHRIYDRVAIGVVHKNMHLKDRVATLKSRIVRIQLTRTILGLGLDQVNCVFEHYNTFAYGFNTFVGLLLFCAF